MKIIEIITENTISRFHFLDGVLILKSNSHFGDRNKERLSNIQKMQKVVTLITETNKNQMLSDLITSSVADGGTFALYNSDYFGVVIAKKVKADETVYEPVTVSQNLYPREEQDLFMIDENPRKFNKQDHANMPLDMKRYKLQKWDNPNLSKEEVNQIKMALDKGII